MNARLSIWSQYYFELTPEEMVDEFIKNGIHCSELADEHGAALFARSHDIIKTGKDFKKYIDEKNFEISQGHLWLGCKIVSDSSALVILLKWIDMYEAIGIKNMVLHCDSMINSDLPIEEKISRNIAKMKMVAEYIKDKDITICLENLRPICRNADELLYIIDQIGSDKFGICLDTGHLNITDKNHREFILKAGKKLKALHIADNEGSTDQHMMMFTKGKVDFVEVVKALNEINYDGLYNLEIPGESRIPLELRNAKIKYIKACYDYLMKQI